MDARLVQSFARTLGVELTDWQWDFVDAVCNTEYVYVHARHDRQEGGSTAGEIWALYNLMLGKDILYFSQLKDINRERMRNMREAIEDHPELFKGCKLFTANGRERIEHPQGNRIRFLSLHGRRSGRGATSDLVIVDSERFKEELLSDILPVMACRRDSQLVWIQSTDEWRY